LDLFSLRLRNNLSVILKLLLYHSSVTTLLAQNISGRNYFYGCYYHSSYAREYLEKFQVPQDTKHCRVLKPPQDVPSILGQDSNLAILVAMHIPVLPKYTRIQMYILD